MKITPNINTMNFTSNAKRLYYDPKIQKEYYSIYGNNDINTYLLYSNYTKFFREDLSPYSDSNSWHFFRKTIAREFEDVPRVNVYDFASSDGSEAYTFIISMIEELGREKAQKFFPLKAYDIDDLIIREAKSGRVLCNNADLKNISENIECGITDYFLVSKNKETPDKRFPYELHPKDFVFDEVEFKKANFLTEIDNIEGSNSLVMCRNFWPYLRLKDREEAIKKLSDKLDSTSVIVIGSFDIDRSAIRHRLAELGFVPLHRCIYRKKR